MSGLLPIGEFSARCGLSVKVLRSYAAEGLLVPAAVDAWSGYRYYGRHQLPAARLIWQLRRAGIALREIREFLLDPDEGRLQAWECGLDREVTDRRSRAQLVELANHNGGTDNTAVIVIDLNPGQNAP